MVDINQGFHYDVHNFNLLTDRSGGERFVGQFRYIYVLDVTTGATVKMALNRIENDQITLLKGLQIETGADNNIFDFYLFNTAQTGTLSIVTTNSPEQIRIQQLFSPSVNVTVGSNTISTSINKQAISTAMTSVLPTNNNRSSVIIQNSDSSLTLLKVALGVSTNIGHYIPVGGGLELDGNVDQVFVGANSSVASFVNIFEFNKL